MLISELRKALFTTKTLFVMMITCFFYICGNSEMWNMDTNVFELFYFSHYLGGFTELVPCLGVFCYGAAFVDEYSTTFIYNYVRCSHRKYICSKIFACYLAAFLATTLGILVYVAILESCYPLLSMQSVLSTSADTDGLGNLLLNGNANIYFIALASMRGVASGTWACLGMAISAGITNKYMCMLSPFIVTFLSPYILERLKINVLYLLFQFELGIGPTTSVLGTLAANITVFMLLSIMFLVVFSMLVKRKVKSYV